MTLITPEWYSCHIMKNGKPETRQLAQDYAERGEPNGWFEEFYARAGGDISEIYRADLKAAPCSKNVGEPL